MKKHIFHGNEPNRSPCMHISGLQCYLSLVLKVSNKNLHLLEECLVEMEGSGCILGRSMEMQVAPLESKECILCFTLD